MNPKSLTGLLAQLFESHSVSYQIEKEWVVPYGKLPAIRANWYPAVPCGRLEIEVVLEDNRVISECFAGVGPDEEGLADSLENFCVNSLHVLLSAFWQKTDPDQVETEDWEIGGQRFRAHIGNFVTRCSDGVVPEIPTDFFPAIERSIREEPLDGRCHWFRHFFCNLDSEQTFESLHDNDSWAPGVRSMRSLPWVKSIGYYSVRHFLLLVPAD